MSPEGLNFFQKEAPPRCEFGEDKGLSSRAMGVLIGTGTQAWAPSPPGAHRLLLCAWQFKKAQFYSTEVCRPSLGNTRRR